MSKAPTATKQAKRTGPAFNERISRARLTMLNNWPFMGHLCLSLRPRPAQEGDGVPTAAISPDGTLVLNESFMDKLSDAEMCGLLAHEVMHPALMCFMRRGDRNALVTIPGMGTITLWNLAHDLSFNPMIAEHAGKGIKLPEGSAIDPRFKDQAAEEIYDALLTEAQENGKGGGGDGSCGTITIGYGIGDDMRPDLSSTPDGQKAAKGDGVAAKKLAQEWKINVVSAAQAQEKAQNGQGSLPAWLRRLVDEIINPKLDWREELSRWLGENGRRNDYSFRRPSRRSAGVGEYLPSLTKHGITDVTVLLDTSGSIGQERLTEALTEIQGICEDIAVAIRVIVVDADIHEDLAIEDAFDLIDHIKGGGGSDFNPAFERLVADGYEGCVVAFTDGAISVPECQPIGIKGTLWVLSEASDMDPTRGKWGEVVRIPQDEKK
jgi:predicted metal-dependent peptidase